MYLDLIDINVKRVKQRESNLADLQLLISHLSKKGANKLQLLINNLNELNNIYKNKILNDPIFIRWLTSESKNVYTAYSLKSSYDLQHLYYGIDLINLSICIFKNEIKKEILLNNFQLIEHLIPGSGSFITKQTNKEKLILSKLPHKDGIYIINDAKSSVFKTSDQDYEFEESIDISSWLLHLEKALEYIKYNESNYYLVNNYITYLLPLKQNNVNFNISFTTRLLPNTVFKNNESSSLLFGETLIHEADHNYYYSLEEFYSFWKNLADSQIPIYHSPWRSDLRPLDGILRGLSAFTRVITYYKDIFINEEASKRKDLREILFKIINQCNDAVSIILASEQLTEHGLIYLNDIINIIESTNSTLNLFQDNIIRIPELKKDLHKLTNPMNFTGDNFTLYNKINFINPNINNLLTQIADTLYKHDSSLYCFITEESKLKYNLDSFILKFGLPYYELMLLEEKDEILTFNAISVHIWSYLMWRTFDNCNDNHEPLPKSQFLSLSSCIRLCEFLISIGKVNCINDLIYHYDLMTAQSILEKSRPIILEDLWKRCSLFLFSPEKIANLSENHLDIYKNYISYLGIAHDTHGFIEDWKSEIHSIPINLMRELNPKNKFDLAHITLLFSELNLKTEYLFNKLTKNTINKKLEIMNYFISNSQTVFKN